MRSIRFVCSAIFLFIVNCSLHAQSKGTITARKIIDKGAKGDIILGERNKKDQLNHTPVILHPRDSIGRKDIIRCSKKLRKTQIKKGS